MNMRFIVAAIFGVGVAVGEIIERTMTHQKMRHVSDTLDSINEKLSPSTPEAPTPPAVGTPSEGKANEKLVVKSA